MWTHALTLPRTIRQIVRHILLRSTFTDYMMSSVLSNSCPSIQSELLTPFDTHPYSTWISWFPVLFYTTIYIGDLHRRISPVPTTDAAQDALNAEATRLGSRALFWFSIVSFASNVLLSLVTTDSVSGSGASERRPHLRFGYGTRDAWWKRILKVLKVPVWMRIHLASLWALGHFVFAGCMFATL
jgi:solute carrier family 45 protein 1/2/4